MRLVAIAIVLAGCPRKTASPAQVTADASTIVVLQEGGGLFAIDAAAAKAESVPGFERLERLGSDARFAAQHGPYLTFSHSDSPYLVDLRDLGRTDLDQDEVVTALRDAWSSSTDPGETIIVGDNGGLITVLTEPGAASRTVPMPGSEPVSLVASPDGKTLGVVAIVGENTGEGTPQDLFAIRVEDGATERWTDDGSALDVAFFDDAHVLFVRDGTDAFHLLDLATRTIQDVPAPAGWSPDLLDDYVGRHGDETTSVYAANGTAPLWPVIDDADERALFHPTTGAVITRARDEQILAVAHDGSAIAVTTECNRGPGGLTLRSATGASHELRPPPAWEVCSATSPDEEGPLRVSAAFSADGRLVFAEPHGSGWRLDVSEADGTRRTILESPTPLHVFSWP